jgi:hypothetical protein
MAAIIMAKVNLLLKDYTLEGHAVVTGFSFTPSNIETCLADKTFQQL